MVASVSVKSRYHFEKERLEARPLLTSEESWWNFIWKLHIIPEVNSSIWHACLDVMQSNWNLTRKRITVDHNIRDRYLPF
jgi:hypothetical protein